MYAGICGNLIRAFSHSSYCFKLLFHSEAAVEKKNKTLHAWGKTCENVNPFWGPIYLEQKLPSESSFLIQKKILQMAVFFFYSGSDF